MDRKRPNWRSTRLGKERSRSISAQAVLQRPIDTCSNVFAVGRSDTSYYRLFRSKTLKEKDCLRFSNVLFDKYTCKCCALKNVEQVQCSGYFVGKQPFLCLRLGRVAAVHIEACLKRVWEADKKKQQQAIADGTAELQDGAYRDEQ